MIQPKPGEVWWIDLGMRAKFRPMMVVSREDPDPERALSVCVPCTTTIKGGQYELDVIPKLVGMVPVSALSTADEWEQFLKMFAVALRAEEWPGAPAATEELLSAAETRLKVKLPPSYRAFLSASNGWRSASRAVPVLRPVEKIRWFKREHRDWVQAYVDPMIIRFRGCSSSVPTRSGFDMREANPDSESGFVPTIFENKALMNTTALSASEKPAQANAKQAAN